MTISKTDFVSLYTIYLEKSVAGYRINTLVGARGYRLWVKIGKSSLYSRFKKWKVSSGKLRAFMEKYVDDGIMPYYGMPDRFEQVEEILKTSVGKSGIPRNKQRGRRSPFNTTG